uniref:Anaphase-promoting complex subunit 8 n=1 Tax=Tetraselmis sp. GSL018 TaxID=582737 RepID=A0A061QKZ3_9CHLO
MDSTTVSLRRAELRKAVKDLNERGLVDASKWCAEQLVGLPTESDSVCSSKNPDLEGSGDDTELDDVYLLAKAYFDCKEYRRAHSHLKGKNSARSKFLRCYSIYLAGVKQQEEERIEKSGPLGKADASNTELEGLELELQREYEQGTADGFSLYVYGLVLIDKERTQDAVEVLRASVSSYPCNWSAWQALIGICRDRGGASGIDLPQHWTAGFFQAALCLELQSDAEGLERLQELYGEFPNSTYIVQQSAIAHYNLRNFDDAQALFQDLLEHDEYRLDGMDIYSNILYVKECFAPLSHLAHRASLTDKYRPETCCIIGNYYSLKSQHEKAVTYFRRALKLSRHYLSAWTLMGHEYVEMKNLSAAIDAYRRAVDINPRDYRAWYGLGQAYELIMMPYYALYYFRQALVLRPRDPRMWCAMGQCYENEQLRDNAAAIQCYKRAANNDDREGIALHKLAKIHERQGDFDTAAHYYTLNLKRIDEEGATGSDALVALSFLAQYHRDKADYAKAEHYCMRLLDFGGPQRDKAGALLRELHSLQQQSGMGSPGSDLDLSPG